MSLFNDFEFETSTPEIQKLQKINKQITESLETDLHYVKELSELSHFIQEELTIDFDESCSRVQEFLKQICTLDTRFLIIREFFHTQDECLPVQMLWGLEIEDLFHFPVYIAMKPEFIDELSTNLIDILFSEYSTKFNVIISLLRPVFISSNLLDPIMYCPSDKLLSTFQKMYVERELSGSSNCETNLIQRLTKEPFMLLSTLISFVKKILKLILVHKSENETLPKITDAINKQNTDWTYNKISCHITIFIKQVLDCLTFESIIEMIHNILIEDDHEFNWKWYLITISTLIVNYPQSADALKKFLDQWLKEAVTNKSKRNLAAVILTVRQCCAESVPPFTSYASWYSQLDNHLETPSEFKFVIDFFSQIVPHEQSLCLKIHINKVPSVPAGAYAAISDYISLAKTRLTDLNETTDYIGLFGEYKTNEKEGRESDIAKVIDHFKETREIMKTVIEASVFRRNYYERVFLSDLLQPEIDKDNPRYKFIEKLFSIGKCPNAMYTDWVIRSNNERQLQKERSEIEIIEIFDTEDWDVN